MPRGSAVTVISRNPRWEAQFPQTKRVLDYAPGASMRQEVYRVAFDEANAELSEILGKFELLRLRKDRIEKVVEALKPLIAMNEAAAAAGERSAVAERQAPASATSVQAPAEASQASPSPIPYPVQQPAMQGSDPFARRIESAVGQSTAAKDVSEYSRLFNTGVSRGN
jgi:hypothetical protein